jgi:hypothetical protein
MVSRNDKLVMATDRALVETSGWWHQIEMLDLSATVRSLPRATDRFAEAKHFLRLVIELEPRDLHLSLANWYSGAHMVAVIGIGDAVKTDCRVRDHPFGGLPIAKEFYLSPGTSKASQRDQVGMNRAYREYRDLRTHFGFSIVCLDSRTLLQDVGGRAKSRPRWFLSPLESHKLGELKNPQLTPEQRQQFNEFAKHKAFVEIAAHHLYIVGCTLQESAQVQTR